MIRVVYDDQILFAQQYGGISRYVIELARHVGRLQDCEASIIAPLYRSRLVDRGRDRISGIRVPVIARTARPLAVVNAVVSAAMLRASRPSVLHETYFRTRSIAPRGVPIVVTVYDMIHERYPQLFAAGDDVRERKAIAVKRADRVICISESTRADVIDMLGVAPDKAVTVHLGVDGRRVTGGEKAVGPEGRPFLLYVGARGGPKNFSAFLDAYAASPSLRRSCAVVAFGGADLDADEVEQVRRLGLEIGRDVVRVAGDDALLSRYYGGALAFVYPSLYEGFGLPLLEAMQAGCPVVCSDTSSMPEVAGDAAVFFDPRQTGAIREALERVVESETVRAALTERGAARAAAFTWQRCAERTANVYRDVVGA